MEEGDRTTKFFHCMANYCRRVNYVEELETDGSVVKGNEHLRY